MVLRWGMSERIGRMALDGSDGQIFLGEEMGKPREYSEQTARVADEEVRTILEDAYTRATTTLRENREALDRLADVLIEKEEVMGEEVLELLGLPPRKKNGQALAAKHEGTPEKTAEEGMSESHDEDASTETPPATDASAGDGVATDEPVPPSEEASPDAASDADRSAGDASATPDQTPVDSEAEDDRHSS